MNLDHLWTGLTIAASLVFVTGTDCCGAEEEKAEYAPAYTAFDATVDAFARGESQRRAAFARQNSVIQYNRWWNGLPPTLRPYYLYPQNRASFYAFGVRPRHYRALGVFEHWPYLPGDIWGYVYDAHVPQSVGQQQIQTGPDRWESHPVYTRVPLAPVPAQPPVRRGPRAY